MQGPGEGAQQPGKGGIWLFSGVASQSLGAQRTKLWEPGVPPMPLLALSTLSLPQFPSWGICREHPGWLLPHPPGDVPGADAAAPKLAAGWQGTTPMGRVTILSPPHRFKMSPGSLGGTKMFIVHPEQSPCALGKGTHGRTGLVVRPAWG